MKKFVKVQPDGGYGWVIVFASALSNFISLSLAPCLGLIFKDTFPALHLSAMEASIIINTNGAFGLLIGPITGVLHKIYGCRKVALLAGLFLTAGMVLTAFAQTFGSLLTAYGIITSLGMQMTESTCRLSVNQYFQKKRSLVTGFVMTAAGFGPILLPQLLRLLLKEYATHEVVLFFGGLCAHVFVAAVLLQPVEWHMKKEFTSEEVVELTQTNQDAPPEKSVIRRALDDIAKTFDLDLLKDPVFDNILIGLALATFAETSFTLLVPFILHDFQLTTAQIATFLSTLGVADMISRFVGPYVGNYFTKPSRLMFAYALVVLIVIKFMILLTGNFYVLLLIGFALGIAKGIRKVYMWLVIPDYVSLEKLASASGMDMLARGACILIGGTVLGAVRGATGNYRMCIILMNCVTIATIVMWTAEYFIVKYKRKNCVVRSNNIQLK